MDSVRAILIADGHVAELEPLYADSCFAMLPIAGKPIVEHSLDSLAAAGVREVLVVPPDGDRSIAATIGDGARWGIQIAYAHGGAGEARNRVEQFARQATYGTLVVRGDTLSTPIVASLLRQAAATTASRVVASCRGRNAGVYLEQHPGEISVDDLISTRRTASPASVIVEVGGRVSWLDSLAEYHRANLDAAAGKYRGLNLPGRAIGPNVVRGLRSRLSSQCEIRGAALIGNNCHVEDGAELVGQVVLGNGVVVDRRATIESAVILSDTYVGEMVEIRRAIVRGNLLIRVDDGSLTEVPDAFLLSDLKSSHRATSNNPSQGIVSALTKLLPRKARNWFSSESVPAPRTAANEIQPR